MIRTAFWCILMMSSFAVALHAENDPLNARIDSLFSRFNKPDVPGVSVVVVQDGKVVLHRSYGMADIEKQVACATNTNFRLASVTKQFTAMAVLVLAENQRLSLDETVPDFFPEFPEYGRQIRLKHLLNHTSGIIDYEDIIPAGTVMPVLDRDVLRLLMQQQKTYFEPGSAYRYSNSAYALLALIVEVRSGRTFARFLKENIFDPLKMKDTLAYEQGSSAIARRAYGYTAEGAAFKPSDQSLTSSVLGDGGIYSSTTDLIQWALALDGGKLISEPLLRQAFTPSVDSDKRGVGYGFGWYLQTEHGLKKQWHTGSTRGFNSLIVRYPEKRLNIILLANRSEADLVETGQRLAEIYL
jgi:CubicO group peptidase (beta-lactamase class C family)